MVLLDADHADSEVRTRDDLALLEGLHEAVHLLFSEKQVHIILRGIEKKIVRSDNSQQSFESYMFLYQFFPQCKASRDKENGSVENK